jgi:hypothetical protein
MTPREFFIQSFSTQAEWLQGWPLPVQVGAVLLALIVVASWWGVFHKAGYAGWWALVPVGNAVMLCKAANRPAGWVLLLLLPVVNVVVVLLVFHDIARAFDKGVLWSLGLLLLPFICWPLLAFGEDAYDGDMLIPV